MFIKEYYIQLPFIITRMIFHLAGEDDLIVARFLESILLKLKFKAGLIDADHEMNEEVSFEDLLFLRVAYEYNKIYKAERSSQFNDYLEKIALSYEDYSQIFNSLLMNQQNWLLFSEWVKFSLQLPIEDEVTRRNLVSLMFELVGHVENSYRDYQHLLKYQRYLIREQDAHSVEMAMDDDQIADEFEDAIDDQNGNE